MGLLQFFVPADDDKTGEDRDAISFAETRAVDSPQATDPEFSLRGTLATGPGARAAGPRRPDPRLELGTRDTITPALDDTITPERLAGASAPRWGEAPGELGTRDTLASDAHMRLRPLDLAAARTSRRPTGDDAELGSRDTLPSDAHMQVLDGRADTVDSRAPLRRVGQDVPLDLEYRRKRAELRAKILGDPIQRFTIGRFQVLGRLGEGGMGVVYAAYDETLDRKVAIKVLRGHASEAAQTRLLREAQALARLTHPNIVAIHEVGEHQGQTFLAMEFVRGESLDAWLETPRPWREVLDVFNQAGRGLEAAHRAGLIHRDFKPHNAILGQDGRVKVLDFGLARASGEALAEADLDAPGPSGALSVSLTHTGAILGTPAYMAPEQHQGRTADARSDQFGFCAALYEALYRQLPFDGATLPALITNILDGALKPPPRDVSVPPWIRKVVTRGLQVDPAARFSSMTELLAALERDPAKRRRRVALTAGALAVMTGGSVALARLQTPEVQAPCAEIPKLFETTWSDTRREATARVFTESALGFAANSWSVIEPALDRYAARWTDARAGSCEAHAQGLVSDTLYDRASACFERRRARVDALLTAFADADASVIENAAIAVAQLPTVDACDDEQRLLAELPPPEDPAAAARVSAARETLARARSLIDLGRYDDATARADEVAAIADEIGYAPLKAEAALTRGTALLWSFTGVGEEAEAALSEAATLAMKSGHDDAAAEAVARRVYVQAEMLAQPAQAQADAWLVDALVARVGDPPALAWLAANNLGVVAERDGDLESATARHARALELVQEDDALRYQRAITLRNIGLVAQGRRDNLEAAEKLARAVTVAEDVLGSEHPQVAIFLTSAGLTLFELDRPSAAEPYLQRALKIADSAGSSSASASSVETLQYLAEIAELWRQPEARALAERCIARARAVYGDNHPRVAFYRVVLASALRDGDDAALDAQITTWIGQLSVAGPRIVALAQLSASEVLLAVGAPGLALPHSERARALLQEQSGDDHSQLATPLRLAGQILLELGRVAEAEAALTRSVELYQEVDDHFNLAWPTRLLGDVARARGDHEVAARRYREALPVFETMDADHPYLAALRLDLARALIDGGGDRAEARALATEAQASYRALGEGFAAEAEDAGRVLASAAAG